MAVAFTRSDRPGNEEATLFYGNERDADAIAIKEELKSDEVPSRRVLFAWESRSLVARRILQVVIGTVGLGIIIAIICAFTLKIKYQEYAYLGNAKFNLEDKLLELKNAANQFVLSGEIGLFVRAQLSERHSKSSSKLKYATKHGISLVLTRESEFSLVVNWTSTAEKSTVFKDCFSMMNSHWYGGSELLVQKWPLEKVSLSKTQFVPKDAGQLRNNSTGSSFGSVLTRYWLNSHGIAVLVDAGVPLYVSIDLRRKQKYLCLESNTSGYLSPAVSKLTYRILSGNDAKSLHLIAINKFLAKPPKIPAVDVIKDPIWVININPEHNISYIEKLCMDIQIKKFPCSCIVIKGQYSKEYGNYDFDPVRFPQVIKMVDSLTSKGCNVSVAVRPLVKIGSQEFNKANQLGYLLQDCSGKMPGLVKWQDHLTGVIDITSTRNKVWFRKQLESFQQRYHLSSFEFNGGSVTHLPFCYQFHNRSMDPGDFARHYADFATELNGISIGVGYKTQELPIFVKMTDKDSSWNDLTGLKSLIPTILTFGIMGYSYVLPSVVGGHQGDADKELYIRWLQASIFFPAIQFSKVPWDYDKETVTFVQELLKLRSTLNPVILEAFYNVTKTGAPIIRPLWWIAPSDPVALTIDSQYMLGDHYLVAPVLEKGQSRKRVYLPVGQWKEKFNKEQKIIDHRKTGTWVEYDVTLKDLPYFQCLTLYS